MELVRIEEREDRFIIDFDFNRKILNDLKDIIPSEYRPQKEGFGFRRNDGNTWHVQKEGERFVMEFAKKYAVATDKSLSFMQYCYLSTFEGEVVESLPLPTSWNHIKKEYAAILTWNSESDKWERSFIGDRVNYSSSRKNASIEYGTSHEAEGVIVEIKDGSYKNIGQSYYRKDSNGWKYLGERNDIEDFEMIKEFVTCEDGFEKKEKQQSEKSAPTLLKEIVSSSPNISIASIPKSFKNQPASPFGDTYFKNNPKNILGEQTIKPGQYGSDKIVVKGTLADAMSRIDVPNVQRFDHFQGNSLNDGLTASTEAPAKTSTQRKKKIANAIKKTKAERKHKANSGKSCENGLQCLADTIIAYNTDIEYKDQNGNTQTYTISKEEIKVWVTYQTNRGLMDKNVIIDNAWGDYFIDNPTSKHWKKWHEMELAAFDGKEWMPEAVFYSGDIYRRIKTVEGLQNAIVAEIGREAYEAQLEKLKSFRPKMLIIGGDDTNNLSLSPFDNVWDEINITELADGTVIENNLSVGSIFRWHYLNDLSRDELTLDRKFASARDIFKFWIEKDRFPNGTDKVEKQKIKRNTQIIGTHHFEIFLRTMLTEKDKGIIAALWNRKHNNYRDIPYHRIPVGFNINDRFKGGQLALRSAQREGVAFLSWRGTGIVAYDVGVGKTMTAIVSISDGFEKGLFKRPMVVVPQKVYRKWIAEIRGEFAAKDIKKGKKVVHKKGDLIAEGILPNVKINDYDNLGVNFIGRATDESGKATFVEEYSITMVTYEGLEQIGFSEVVENELADRAVTMLSQGESGRAAAIKEAQAQKWVDKALDGTSIDIDDMGIDCIIVDEGHNFRNLFMEVKGDVSKEGEREKKNHFSGSGGTPSTRAIKLFMLNSYIQSENNNRNTYGLTATPFTNRATEIYSMMAHYDYQGLRDFGVHNLAQFCEAFIDERYEDVWTAGGTFKSKVTIRSYNNLTSLQEIIFRSINYKTGEDANILRPEKVVLPLFIDEKGVALENEYVVETRLTPTPIQMDWLREIAMFGGDTSDKIEASKLSEYYFEDEKGNIPGRILIALNASRTVTFSPFALNLGGNAMFNVAEIDAKQFVDGSPKIKYICECIKSVRLYHLANKTDVSGQIIYSDRGTEWFGHIRDYLVELAGYTPKEIAIFHGGVGKGKRERIKEAFQRNEIKVIIGSSTMREGVDLQKHCSVIYVAYLDWNPPDLHQLFGRGWRFGNKHSHIRIVVPLVENSSDIFTWQKLSEKMSRINTVWNRSGKAKMFEEGELNAEELKKGLINDPEELARTIIAEQIEGIDSALRIAKGELERLEKAKEEIEEYNEKTYFLEQKAKEAITSPQSLDRPYSYQQEKTQAFDQRVDKLKESNITDIRSIYSIVRRYADLQYSYVRLRNRQAIDQHRKLSKKLTKIEEQILSRSNLKLGDDFSPLLDEIAKKVEELTAKLDEINSEENFNAILERVKAEKETELAGRKPVAERVNEFARLNYLLDCRQGIHTCDIYGRIEEIETGKAVEVVEQPTVTLELEEVYKPSKKFFKFVPKEQIAATKSMGEAYESVVRPLDEQINQIPKLYHIEKQVNEWRKANKGSTLGTKDLAVVYAHFFIGGTDWYILEWDGKDTMFGYTILNRDVQMSELGYISLNEIHSVKVNNGAFKQPIELDFYWTPKYLQEVLYEYDGEYFDAPKMKFGEELNAVGENASQQLTLTPTQRFTYQNQRLTIYQDQDGKLYSCGVRCNGMEDIVLEVGESLQDMGLTMIAPKSELWKTVMSRKKSTTMPLFQEIQSLEDAKSVLKEVQTEGLEDTSEAMQILEALMSLETL